MIRGFRLAALGAVLLSAYGCSYQTGFNSTYIPEEPAGHWSADHVQIVMSEYDANYTSSSSPSSFTGGGTTLVIPMGQIVREVTSEALRDRFSGEIGFANEMLADRYQLGIRPTVRKWDYKYNSLRNLGFAITIEGELDLQVEILDPSGEVIFENTYASGLRQGQSYFASFSPEEKVSALLHELIYEHVEQALDDARPAITQELGLTALGDDAASAGWPGQSEEEADEG